MSYYINTEGRTTTLKKKKRINPPKIKNIKNNINNPINNSYYPMNCQCKCHHHIHNTHNTISNQLKNYDSQTMQMPTNLKTYIIDYRIILIVLVIKV